MRRNSSERPELPHAEKALRVSKSEQEVVDGFDGVKKDSNVLEATSKPALNNIPFACASMKEERPLIADTPKPPYYAVIFTSVRTDHLSSNEEYSETAHRMVELAKMENGFLGMESARDGVGLTVSYWKDAASIKQWKANCEHRTAQGRGRKQWYEVYKARVCKVERDYGFSTK